MQMVLQLAALVHLMFLWYGAYCIYYMYVLWYLYGIMVAFVLKELVRAQ